MINYTRIKIQVQRTTQVNSTKHLNIILHKLFPSKRRNPSQLILLGQCYPDAKNRQRHHKKAAGPRFLMNIDGKIIDKPILQYIKRFLYHDQRDFILIK